MGIGEALQKAFVWGDNGAQLTPQDIEKRRTLADALVKSSMDYSPVASPWQGLARVAQGVVGALQERDLNNQLAAGQKSSDADYNAYMSSLGAGAPTAGTASTLPAPGASSQISTTSPGVIAPGTANDIQKQFLAAAQSGIDQGDGTKIALTNPYGLAALAATGERESSYDPSKVNASWADPSQSGQQGVSGGLLSWRNERLAALRNYAQANGEQANNISPAMQAKFFLQEDPNLIQGLNNAKSPAEASALMANAWKFAGYDQPGGEAATRAALTAGYVPRFQQTQVASLDPSSGMQPANAAQAIQRQAPGSGYTDPQVTTAYAPTSQAAQPSAPAPVGSDPASIAASLPQFNPQSGSPLSQSATAAPAGVAPSAAAPMQIAQATPPTPAPAGNNAALVKALLNPFTNPTHRAVLSAYLQANQARSQALYEQQLKQADPEYQINLAKGRYELQHLGQVTPDTQAQIDAQARQTQAASDNAIKLADHNQQLKAGDPLEQANVAKTNAETANVGSTNDIREYQYYAAAARQAGHEPVAPDIFWQEMKKSAAANTTINTGDNSSAFAKKADEEAATRIGGYISDGASAGRLLGDVQQLADLGTQLNTGKGAQVIAALGPYAQALGIDVKSLPEAQAYQAIIDRMAPNMRPAGAGSSSDTDVRMFLSSLPSLGNTPGGNQIITQTLGAIQQQKITAAQIAQKAVMPKDAGGITWQEAEQQIRDLGNPYASFNRYRQTLSQNGGKQLPSDNLTRIKSVEDYNGLPKGTQYIDPNGKLRVKN